MKKLIFTIGIILLSLNSCTKNNEPELTEITNDGKGGISCLINGEVLNSHNYGYNAFDPESVKVGDIDGRGLVHIEINNRHTNNWKIVHMQLYDIDLFDSQLHQMLSIEGNTYQLADYGIDGQTQTCGTYWSDWRGQDNNLNLYHTTQILKGEVHITHHDIENRILSGTFWFDAKNENGEIIRIRDGRFDKEYSGF